jgi:hypothetical protein
MIEIQITTSAELESQEFLEEIEKLGIIGNSDSSLFCKLLIAFFGIGHYVKNDTNELLKYDTHAVNESLVGQDRMEFSKSCISLEQTLKSIFKVEEKSDTTQTVTLNMVIVKIYTEIINLATASRSLRKVQEIRKLTAIEQKKFEDVNERIKNALATRNHILNVLDDFTLKTEAELPVNIANEITLEFIFKGQFLLKLLSQWKHVES